MLTVVVYHASLRSPLSLAQEWSLGVVAESKDVALQVDDHAVAAENVESEQEVHASVSHHVEAAVEVVVLHLHLT